MPQITNRAERIQRLTEIKDEMKRLHLEAELLLQGTPAYALAEQYWLPLIARSLDDDHNFGAMKITMQDTIDGFDEDH